MALGAMSWLVLVAALGIVLAAVLVPRVAGATPMTVLTGSMTPAYPAGTLVVVRPLPEEEIGVGTVITFQLRSGDPTMVTHRVVGVGYDGAGERVFTTQGDSNESADAASVRGVQVRGEVWYAVPWLGRLNILFSADQHELMTRIAAGGCFAYALGVAVRGWRRRSRPRRRALAGAVA
ncbi:Signal peptidase I W [Nocardioides dokdonensis FR1436]|uniref:Signal peptidase I n=1 Tax=Nocardioides dokdonensis FR1436 TaxID=1300347 RepID=A0A1A9GJ08_9ACTN|nr:signal peptidase I [Nocardioides dokdonensis]ANH37491.1 Signal peptidase I W [Nocardioides dokdonensis FR1436]